MGVKSAFPSRLSSKFHEERQYLIEISLVARIRGGKFSEWTGITYIIQCRFASQFFPFGGRDPNRSFFSRRRRRKGTGRSGGHTLLGYGRTPLAHLIGGE